MRTQACMLVLVMIGASMSGCIFGSETVPPPEEPVVEEIRFWVTGPDGQNIDFPALPLEFAFSNVGEQGAEPSIGITSSGCMFFIAFEKVMRSCDHGGSWEIVDDIMSHPSTSDPWGWVDPITDRVYNVQMVGLITTWIAWSDDDGETWLGNPHDSGPIPLNDHIKLGTGPWTSDGYGAIANSNPATWETAPYFCYNKIAWSFCYTSFDGGASFEVGGQIFGMATTNGGLHGAITSAPDGTVYVPPRVETPTIIMSKDNGLTWSERTMGLDVGTPYPRKNSEVGTDSESNAYHIWTSTAQGVYMSRSTDSGNTWEENSIRISPVGVISSVFPHIDAGDPGRIAITYLGSEDAGLLNTSDIDGNPWDGNAHYAPDNTTYHLYITYSLNALDDEPIFHTMRVTDDPVQMGSICLNSGDCRDLGGSNRNLLDFNDLHIDLEGRVYVAFADGCTGACAEGNNSTAEDSRDRLGSVYFLSSGPSLFEAVGDLAEFM